MDKVSHFEIPADDKNESREFYEAIFGWAIKDVPMKMGEGEGEYTTATTTETDTETMMPKEPGGINGALVERSKGTVKAPVITITVSSIDDHLAKVDERKGKVIEGKQEVEGMGYFAYVEDPAGNVIGLLEDMKK
jgi:predicted enzyme related to lactoylglutathione lyase